MAHIQRKGARWQARYRGPDARERTKMHDRIADAERWLAGQQLGVVQEPLRLRCESRQRDTVARVPGDPLVPHSSRQHAGEQDRGFAAP